MLSVVSHKDAGHAFKDLGKLMLPVEEFVNEIRREDIVDRAPVMNVATNDSLLHVMKKVGGAGKEEEEEEEPRSPHPLLAVWRRATSPYVCAQSSHAGDGRHLDGQVSRSNRAAAVARNLTRTLCSDVLKAFASVDVQ